jgi:tetratricopeptide (TPR) repeat protein
MPMLEGFVPTPLFVLLAFERWNDVLKVAAPDSSLIYATAQWHFALAMALGALGKTSPAEQEAKLFYALLAKLPHDASFDPLNTVVNIARVQENLLAGTIKRGAGEELEKIIEAFQHAVANEDVLNYSEPPSWYPSVRPLLGRVLLEEGQATAAEKVFRTALEKSPRYAPALTGLRDSLRAQNRSYEAGQIDEQLRESQRAVDAITATRSRNQP